MQPRVLIGLGAVALAVATYALALRPQSREPAPEKPAPAPRDAPRSDVEDALQRVLEPPPDPEMKLPPAAARKAAEASFESIMQTLETLGDAGQRLPRARRDELYRNTNDAFSALSATLDAENSAEDRQALEDANIRMKAMLGELGVRVPRRPQPRFEP